MSRALVSVKPAVRAIRAYTLAARDARIKVNQNESPYDVSPETKRAVMERALARPWSRYPPFDPRELTDALADFAGWRRDGVLAGNGSNELIEALLMVVVGEGTKVVIPQPTFTLYALLTGILGGQSVRVALAPDLSYDTGALIDAARAAGAVLTIVCSPNNPTGTAMAPADVARLCAASEGLVAVDEAYHEFSGRTVAPLLAEHPNLVVLRTFSKAMGLAGLRVGYLLAAPELVAEIDKARLPYNINFISQLAALAVLERHEEREASVRRMVQGRETLSAALASIPGLRPYPSQANFVLVEVTSGDAKALFEALYADGILVRDVTSYPMLERCLRISVGTEAENDAVLASLRRHVGRAAAQEVS